MSEVSRQILVLIATTLLVLVIIMRKYEGPISAWRRAKYTAWLKARSKKSPRFKAVLERHDELFPEDKLLPPQTPKT